MRLLRLSNRREDEDERDRELLRLLRLSNRRDDEDERDRELLRLMGLSNRREEEDRNMRLILQAINQLSDRREDSEGDRLLAFLRSMMGNDATLEDVMHNYHSMHLLQKEYEMKERQEQADRERGIESKAQELLSFLHQAYTAQNQMQHRMMGGMNGPYGGIGPYGNMPMGQRLW